MMHLDGSGGRQVLGRLALLAAVTGVLFAVLLAAVRPWYTAWGATAAEQAASLPGDGVVPDAQRETRAISIAAPPEQVFAWVAQLGQDRAGFYSYDLLENLAGCQMPRIERLDPALQHWEVGQKLWMYPAGKLDGTGYVTLLELQPGRALVFGTRAPGAGVGAPISGTWSLVVERAGPDASRLIARGSGSPAPGLLGVAFNRTVFEPIHFAMERRMLEGIRGLAEGAPLSRGRDAAMVVCWVLAACAFAATAVLVLLGRRWRYRLAAFVAAGAVFQIATLVQPTPALGMPLVLGLWLFILWVPAKRLGRTLRLLPAVDQSPG